MDYKRKYEKYKIKYEDLKNQKGGKYATNDNTKLTKKISKSNRSVEFKMSGVRVASVHYPEGPVGTTLVYFLNKAKVVFDIRGGWAYPCGVSDSVPTDNRANGIVIAGGSSLGTEAISGVNTEYMKSTNYKDWGSFPGAIIYSSNLKKNRIYPDVALGRFAMETALKSKSISIPLGQAGAGFSAEANNSPAGQGCAHRVWNGINMVVITVVNALGNIFSKDGKKLSPGADLFKRHNRDVKGKNTTITILITDLKMSHLNMEQVAKSTHSAMARVIQPFHTLYDGDTLFFASTEKLEKKVNMIAFTTVFNELACDAVISCLE